MKVEVTDLKDPNAANAAVADATGVQVKLWISSDSNDPIDTGTPDVLVTDETITGGVLTIDDSDVPVITATGGTVTDVTGYKVHSFSAGGTFEVTSGTGSVEYLIVAGGGGGGSRLSAPGGGGAGGLLTGSISLSPGTYVVSVGLGGAGGPAEAFEEGVDGGNSSVAGIGTAVGGGGGGAHSTTLTRTGRDGGSGGGGGGRSSPAGAGGAGTAGQGYAGGAGNTDTADPGAGGGGGGAGGVGQTAPNSTTAGTGGSGVSSSITGTAVTYATGGRGGDSSKPTSVNGTDGLGEGGSGAGGTENTAGGDGGDGRVILRYPTTGSLGASVGDPVLGVAKWTVATDDYFFPIDTTVQEDGT